MSVVGLLSLPVMQERAFGEKCYGAELLTSDGGEGKCAGAIG